MVKVAQGGRQGPRKDPSTGGKGGQGQAPHQGHGGKKEEKTKEQLDEELEAYMAQE